MAAVEAKYTSGEGSSEADTVKIEVDKVRSALLLEHETNLKRVEQENLVKVNKANRTTKLMICMQNAVREMLSEKLK